VRKNFHSTLIAHSQAVPHWPSASCSTLAFNNEVRRSCIRLGPRLDLHFRQKLLAKPGRLFHHLVQFGLQAPIFLLRRNHAGFRAGTLLSKKGLLGIQLHCRKQNDSSKKCVLERWCSGVAFDTGGRDIASPRRSYRSAVAPPSELLHYSTHGSGPGVPRSWETCRRHCDRRMAFTRLKTRLGYAIKITTSTDNYGRPVPTCNLSFSCLCFSSVATTNNLLPPSLRSCSPFASSRKPIAKTTFISAFSTDKPSPTGCMYACILRRCCITNCISKEGIERARRGPIA
jgi:hypothetical protein